MKIKQPSSMRKYCEGTTNDEVSWCHFYGSEKCISDGKCGYRSKKLLEDLGKEFQNDCRLLEMLGGGIK